MSNEQDLYIIKWVSNINGATGCGTKALPKSTAELWVEELNKKYGALFTHTAVKDAGVIEHVRLVQLTIEE